ncbi:molybdopterin molybdenumtransferase [Oxobacter pfennigii]|uniref:Molybdopterin molybdenumtransferase n=1 Tax=Oxobacter pfennigii TaxID=36849 RepID=A0A0P9ACB4_9CLOT|nr:molybdopterin molybdotransferase MoeA [Oxobacter pfennigii]KPU42739.1 molybdopterin molybdenumtransferase [Oxobacter pfennigii]
MEFFNVVTVSDARMIIDDNFNIKIGYEIVNLDECTGRILYEDVISKEDVPAFKRSAVDGYAVFSKDVFGASESIPSMMNLKGEVLMGQVPVERIEFPGDCVYVPTGGMLPYGANSVVMMEYTERLDESTLLISNPAAPGENIIDAGEDIKTGEVAIKKGTRLRPYEVGVLSSLGFLNIKVSRKPKVAIISTGDEIVKADGIPKPGQVRDINTHLLYSLIMEDSGEPVVYGLIKDEFSLLKNTVEKALSECDAVIISGGSSVGKKDETVNVINSFEGPGVLIHGISVKPGKPTIVGKVRDKIIFGLPGHPLACAVMHRVIVSHYLNSLTGHKLLEYPVTCTFNINYHKAKGREEYLPVMLDYDGDKIKATPVFGKSGLMTGFSKAWGYIRIEKNQEGIKEGQVVYAYKF